MSKSVVVLSRKVTTTVENSAKNLTATETESENTARTRFYRTEINFLNPNVTKIDVMSNGTAAATTTKISRAKDIESIDDVNNATFEIPQLSEINERSDGTTRTPVKSSFDTRPIDILDATSLKNQNVSGMVDESNEARVATVKLSDTESIIILNSSETDGSNVIERSKMDDVKELKGNHGVFKARKAPTFLVQKEVPMQENTGEDGYLPVKDDWLDIVDRIDSQPNVEVSAYERAAQMAYLIHERQDDERCKSSVALCDSYTSMWPQIDGLCDLFFVKCLVEVAGMVCRNYTEKDIFKYASDLCDNVSDFCTQNREAVIAFCWGHLYHRYGELSMNPQPSKSGLSKFMDSLIVGLFRSSSQET